MGLTGLFLFLVFSRSIRLFSLSVISSGTGAELRRGPAFDPLTVAFIGLVENPSLPDHPSIVQGSL